MLSDRARPQRKRKAEETITTDPVFTTGDFVLISADRVKFHVASHYVFATR